MPFVRFVGFSVVRAWQGFWRNAMMSLAATATVILMLALLAALFIVISGLNSGLEFIESKVAVTAQLVDDLPADRPGVADRGHRSAAGRRIGRLRVARARRCAGCSQYYRDAGQELDTRRRDDHQLFASLEISLTDPDAADDVATALADHPSVERILTKQAEYDTLLGIINVIRTVGFGIVGLVGLTVLFMIINTIRIAVYSRATRSRSCGWSAPPTRSSAGRSSSRASCAASSAR